MTEFILKQGLLFFYPCILLGIWEVLLPARKIKYFCEGRELLFACLVFLIRLSMTLSFMYLAQFSIVTLFQSNIEAIGILSIPIWLRLVAAFFVSDFCFYWLHRGMHHNEFLWKAHKFHHTTEQMWGLPGIGRLSFMHLLIVKWPYLWFPILAIPPEILFIVAIHANFQNYWQHLNVKEQRWMKKWMQVIELIYVTPRYHRMHHISDKELQCKNVGSYFTFFDRIFGTYANPEDASNSEKPFGIGEDNPITVRMIIGI